MKSTIKPFLLTCFVLFSLLSCNKEELFTEDALAEIITEEENNEEETNEDVEETAETDYTLPCDFTLNEIQANSTIIINCTLDLNGETINLPPNVTIEYEGGDIINGTLNFSEGSTIDGNILNSTLTIGGSSPQMKDTAFQFDPQRWGIVEGVVSDAVALNNKEILNIIIAQAQSMGITTFEIDKIDAYFEVSSPGNKHQEENTILIPSNFHFKMGKDCNLRVQPTHIERSALLSSRGTENVIISGGKLWGDRYTHDYKTITSRHGWGHVMMIRGVHNGIIDGVEMHEGAGDGIQIAGLEHRNNDGSLKSHGRESKNVTLKNCLINDNRRNNISMVDGTDIYIEYNTIKNSGSGDDSSEVSSNGTSPRAGIDIEAFKNNAPDNNSVYDWEKTENIHIRHNVFEENYAVDVALYNGEKAYVYENTFRSNRGISAAYSYNNKIYNNRFERPEGLMSGSAAIKLEPRYWGNGTHRIKDFEVNNNTFTGYQFAIVAGGQGHEFKNNIMTNCQRGIILIVSEDLEFDNNKITSNVDRSYGYYTFSTELSIKNCLIKNGETNVENRGLYFYNNNNDETGDITIDNVTFNGGISLNAAQNVTIKNSAFDEIKIVDCEPILINNN
ncbi:right-handed parallel beta-helix repeat-containing protein [Changchengzhania lutea]|uniref:right-handed parallel beta-helix repeat-containing protein n=1 Tax=Changchengzhania lutea TaxID=2049305 RepID=UPI00115DF80E|nr:right-handed parallel beta-helix repeat-containing protein [Changchengzhania lutea]